MSNLNPTKAMFIENAVRYTGAQIGSYSPPVSNNIPLRRDTMFHILVAKYGEARAEAVWKMKNAYYDAEQERKAHTIKLIDHNDPDITTATSEKIRVTRKPRNAIGMMDICRCEATTLSGKRCPFKASTGTFCKKHQV
jgi:hypothetical protein